MKPDVLVTGPADGRGLAAALADKGLRPVCLPMLQTQQVQFSPAVLRQMQQSFARADAVVVSSPRAAAALVDVADMLRKDSAGDIFSPTTTLFAIGSVTADALQTHGLPATAPADAEGAEALLTGTGARLTALRDGARVVLIAGYAARPLLKLRLRRAGLAVEEYKVYRRLPPVFSDAQRQQLSEALISCRLAIVASATALRFLVAQAAQVGHDGSLPPLLTVSDRLVATATALGWPKAHSAGSAATPALTKAAQRLLCGKSAA